MENYTGFVKSRAQLVFENSIKSDATREKYAYYLRKFIEHYKLEDIDSILQLESKKLQIMMEDFLFYLKGKVKPNTIKPYFQALELLCIVTDKDGLNFKKIHKMYPDNEKTTGKKPWSTKDIQRMLEYTRDIRTKVIIHLLASTGCRIGSVCSLKIGNTVDMPNDCMAILFYEGTDQEYWGFLTPEATRYMKQYLHQRQKDGEVLQKSSPLIREKYSVGIAKPRFCTRGSMGMIVHRIIELANIRSEKIGNRYETMTNHAFRKRFNTILKLNKNINPAIIEKLMGHKINLDGVYFTPTTDDLFEEFVKAIPELTISDSERLQIQGKIKDEKISKLESQKDKTISDLQEMTRNLSERLQKQESITSEIGKIQLEIRETLNRESDVSNPNYPDGGPFDTRLVNLEMEKINDKSMVIFDTEFEERIEVVLRENKVYCTLDKSTTCKHVLFALGNPDFYKHVKKHDIAISFSTAS